MAHKAPLLALINQGKCSAVTHTGLSSAGEGGRSFMTESLYILARVVCNPELPQLSSSTGGVSLMVDIRTLHCRARACLASTLTLHFYNHNTLPSQKKVTSQN